MPLSLRGKCFALELITRSFIELIEISPGVIAFIRRGANVGLIRTGEGFVVVDTTSKVEDMQGLLDAAGVSAGAEVIVPGHGLLCGEEEVARQLDYLETSWARTADHLAQGHSIEETAADPGYPIYSERGVDKLHKWNIEVMHRQLKKR